MNLTHAILSPMLAKKLAVQAPFWASYPSLGVARFPTGLDAQILFWVSAVAYSTVYFLFIAVAAVMFVQGLWIWTSIREFIATTLYDVVYKNIWLPTLFVIVETAVIYVQARSKKSTQKPKKPTMFSMVVAPAVMLALLYIILKILTGYWELEPNALIVLPCAYVALVVRYALMRFN